MLALSQFGMLLGGKHAVGTYSILVRGFSGDSHMLRTIGLVFLWGIVYTLEAVAGMLVKTEQAQVLFVYGTLKAGGRLHPYLINLQAHLMGTGTIQGNLYDMGGFPAMIVFGLAMRSPGSLVRGEVYKIPGDVEALRTIDELEGYDSVNRERSFYTRICRDVEMKGGPERAWMYVILDPPADEIRIPSGEWTNS